jgi:hypothetical protein
MSAPHTAIGTPDENCNNNAIQFRPPWQLRSILAELQASGVFTTSVASDVADSMDLDPSQVFEIVDRAQCARDDIVSRTHNPSLCSPISTPESIYVRLDFHPDSSNQERDSDHAYLSEKLSELIQQTSAFKSYRVLTDEDT